MAAGLDRRGASPALRALIGLAAVANLTVAAGFVAGWSWAAGLWPWQTGRLSLLFLASMLAAIGFGAAWVAASGELQSLPGGFANLAVALAGIGGYLLTSVPEQRSLGTAVLVLALFNAGLLVLATRLLPPPAGTPVPALVRGSCLIFTVVLAGVGVALIAGVEGVMPWPLEPPTRGVFGWIFLGDALYFAYAVARPRWSSARAQLWSFLGYNAVLLPPLLAHLPDVAPALRDNLVVYLAILVYSSLLAVRYLIIDPRTRGWGRPAPH